MTEVHLNHHIPSFDCTALRGENLDGICIPSSTPQIGPSIQRTSSSGALHHQFSVDPSLESSHPFCLSQSSCHRGGHGRPQLDQSLSWAHKDRRNKTHEDRNKGLLWYGRCNAAASNQHHLAVLVLLCHAILDGSWMLPLFQNHVKVKKLPTYCTVTASCCDFFYSVC